MTHISGFFIIGKWDFIDNLENSRTSFITRMRQVSIANARGIIILQRRTWMIDFTKFKLVWERTLHRYLCTSSIITYEICRTFLYIRNDRSSIWQYMKHLYDMSHEKWRIQNLWKNQKNTPSSANEKDKKTKERKKNIFHKK